MKLILLLSAILFTTSIAYSQQTILNDKGDTLIGFKIEEARFLLSKVHEVEQLESLNYTLKEQKGECEFINIEQRRQIRDYETIVKNKDEAMSLIRIQVTSLENDVAKEHNRYKRQVIYKWLAIAGGVIATSYIGIYK